MGAALKASLWAGQRDGPAGRGLERRAGSFRARGGSPRARLGREARRKIGERSARAQPTAGPRGRVARAITLPPPGVTLDSPAARRRGPCGPEVDRRRRNAAALGDLGANEYSCDRAAQLSLRPKGAASQRQLRVRNGWRTACLTARYGGSGVRAHVTWGCPWKMKRVACGRTRAVDSSAPGDDRQRLGGQGPQIGGGRARTPRHRLSWRGHSGLGGKSRRATHQAGRPTKVERAAAHAHGRSGSARGYLGADSKPRAAEFGTDVAEQNQ